ncbi:MAG: hypothetical protein KBF57_11065, partial [Saprospiraceae bacterium]|nr:hypothetical protein [Saprospiraceae bacterium]
MSGFCFFITFPFSLIKFDRSLRTLLQCPCIVGKATSNPSDTSNPSETSDTSDNSRTSDTSATSHTSVLFAKLRSHP